MKREYQIDSDQDKPKCLIEDMEVTLESAKLPNIVPNCCIYKVPQTIRGKNEVAYTPQVVSIGPLHHGDKRFEPMEKLKLGYLKNFLVKTDFKLEDCIRKVREKEGQIRECYEETILQTSDDFVKMILIDACFIIEYFLRSIDSEQWIKIDPILSKPNRWHDIKLDLILLENQLPFFVLEDLFVLINDRRYSTFLEVSFLHFKESYITIDISKNRDFTFDYFSQHYLEKRDGGSEEVKVRHFTDLLRNFYLPCHEPQRGEDFVEHLYSLSQLVEAGVKLKVGQNNNSIIELQFENGELTMPRLMVHDDSETFFRNMAALEQCHYPYHTYIGDYIVLMDFLINEGKDVDILVDKEIMVNILGDSQKVVDLFNNICSGMVFSSSNASYHTLGKNLNAFYEHPMHKHKAVFIRDYFSTPWKIASLITAVVLLLLTLIQTICSLIPEDKKI